MARPALSRLYLFALLGWAFDFYDLVLLGFIKEPVGHDLHLTPTGQAWLLGVALGASGIGGVAGGALADRLGKRTMLSWTVLIYSAGSLLCGLAPSAWEFVAGRAVVGLGVGSEWAIGHGMLAEAVPPAQRGRWSAALQSGEPLGVALAAVVGYLILPHVGWRAVLIGSSATALLAVFARRSAHLPDDPATTAKTTRELFTPLLRRGLRGRLAAAWALGVFKLGTYWTCYTWLPSFLRDMGQPVARSLTWMLTAQGGQLLGMLTFGAVSDRLGRDRDAGVRVAGALGKASALLDGHVRPRRRLRVHGGLRRAARGAVPDGSARHRDGHDLQSGARGPAPGARGGAGGRRA
jgi:MFS family permease